ncbi:hypothetical protein STAQ_28120 [Allostella sp. ATCC 35155]|nr:hypothetical protein STAQ_28120 [Stella sp. ATCC 35155]
MSTRLGDGPIQPEFLAEMNAVASAIDVTFNGTTRGPDRKVGFVLLCFPFGATDGRCNFISNGADRRDLIALFKEMIARFEGQPEMKGRA